MNRILKTAILTAGIAATTLATFSAANADDWRWRHHHHGGEHLLAIHCDAPARCRDEFLFDVVLVERADWRLEAEIGKEIGQVAVVGAFFGLQARRVAGDVDLKMARITIGEIVPRVVFRHVVLHVLVDRRRDLRRRARALPAHG